MEGVRRLPRSRSIITPLLIAIALLSASLVATGVPAAASTGIQVFVSYADSSRPDATSFPTPWYNSPATTFSGCHPTAACDYDGGAIRVVNNSGSTVTVNNITVHVDTCMYTGWPSAVLQPGAELIVTQLTSGPADGCTGPTPDKFDLSDVGPLGSKYGGDCNQDSIQPTVDVTIDNTTTHYTDSGQVLNTGGVDGFCNGNESTQWTLIGSKPCKGSQLTLAPPTQTHPVLSTATVTATFKNVCPQGQQNQPLSNTAVDFAITAGPNTGITGSGVTDANGQASFSYSSRVTGTDTLQASVTNIFGSIPSNSVTVIWTIDFAPGGGAFVIGDLENHPHANVYWWGAQWWKFDPMTRGLAPASFKGYAMNYTTPWCGGTWTTRPGNSPHPPAKVSGAMFVIVSSHITKSGPIISGNILHIVRVQTNPGYGPNPGHRGTGVIIDQLC